MHRTRSTRRALAGPARRAGALLACLAAPIVLATAATASAAGDASPPALKVESARWESGYGVKFFQVVGTVTNQGDRPLGAVQVHTELLDAAGAVVASVDCWNGRAEALEDLRGEAAQKKLADAHVQPIPPGASDKWRCTFLEEDVPRVDSHRAKVAATLPAP